MRWSFLKNRFGSMPLGIEAIFPALMALALFAAITDILYSGGRRENLAAQGEKFLIERSLRAALKPTENPGKTVTISLTDADLANYEAAPSRLVRDASLEVYARVMKVVASADPEMLVVSWLSSAQPTTSEGWQPVRAALAAIDRPHDVMVAYPIAEMSSVPRDIKERFVIKEGEDCVYEVNSFCSYNPQWHNWMVQGLAERLWKSPPAHHISSNLPHVLPNFLLNLPRRASIPDYSFRDVLERPEVRVKLRGAYVFVGNATSQETQFANNKSVIRRTFSVENAESKDLLNGGTPLHIFWAQVAQMFIDGSTVAVTPISVTLAILLLLGCAILFVLFKLGSAAGMAFFLVYAWIFPMVNDFGLVRFKVYVPMFDASYGGFLVFLFSAFGFLSYNNFKTWQLRAKRRQFESTADLKGNFTSLISHNLNTPIAKLQGLIDVMLATNQFTLDNDNLKCCRVLVARLLLCVRTVLLTTALEQQSLSRVGLKLNALKEEYEDTVACILQRLSIHTEVVIEDEESRFTTLSVDSKIFGHLLGAMAAAVSGLQPANVRLNMLAESRIAFDEKTLTLTAASQVAGTAGKTAVLLARFKAQPGALMVDEEDFLLQALLRFLTTMAQVYGGTVELAATPLAQTLTFKMGSAAGRL